MSSRSRVLVSGMVAGDPGQGGATWAVLQYVLGLKRLGHDVWLVEPVDRLTAERERFFRRTVEGFGLGGRSALLEAETRRTVGASHSALLDAAAGADVLLNVSGMLRDDALLERVGLRVWLDLDPCFNQLWHAVEEIDMGLDAHDRFVTVGQRIGEPDCSVPTCGKTWTRTLPPVVLDRWPDAGPRTGPGLTTVGNWRAYGSIEAGGIRYGQKAHSVRALLRLPSLSAEPLMPAFAIHPGDQADLEALVAHGWLLVDPAAVAGTPDAYRAFVRGSWAELGIAKEGYVVSRCGWFGDRSACYLASGRPVVAQDTGFAATLPVGEGLLAFSSPEEGAARIAELRSGYTRHARAARELALAYFDSDLVLRRLLEAL